MIYMRGEWLASLKTELTKRFDGKSPDGVVFVGVGNRMRGDDGIGPVIIDLIKDKVPNAIDTGDIPENFTSMIKRLNPMVIVLLDAVSFDEYPPGYAKILEIDDVEKRCISTHNFSLDVIMSYLKEGTGADVFMIGVQPSRITDNEVLTPELYRAADSIARAIIESRLS